MKKLILSVLFFACASVVAFSQSLDDVLEKHFEATGAKKLAAKKSISMKAKMVQNAGGMTMEIPLIIDMKRPDKSLSKVTIQGMNLVMGYNGKEGWMINPMTGSTAPQDMPEEQVKQTKEQFDMLDGQLYNWKDKGLTVELLGKEQFEGSDVYKVKVTKKEGDNSVLFIDAENYIVLKSENVSLVEGKEFKTTSFMSNYKEVDGIVMPFSSTTKTAQGEMQMIFDSYEFDKITDDSIFDRPKK